MTSTKRGKKEDVMIGNPLCCNFWPIQPLTLLMCTVMYIESLKGGINTHKSTEKKQKKQ